MSLSQLRVSTSPVLGFSVLGSLVSTSHPNKRGSDPISGVLGVLVVPSTLGPSPTRRLDPGTLPTCHRPVGVSRVTTVSTTDERSAEGGHFLVGVMSVVTLQCGSVGREEGVTSVWSRTLPLSLHRYLLFHRKDLCEGTVTLCVWVRVCV